VSASAVSASDIWAVGSTASTPARTLAKHWNGQTWRTVPTQNAGYRSSLNAVVAIGHNDVWAVGQRTNRDASGAPLIEHWNGTSWKLVPAPKQPRGTFASSLVSASGTASDDVWAVGYRQTDGLRFKALTEHWNGTRWSVVPSYTEPRLGSRLAAVSALGADEVWAVGETGSGPSKTLIEHWDGSSWRRVRSPSPGGSAQYNSLFGVTALTKANVWAVGSYTTARSSGRTLALHWDGKAWTRVKTVNPPGSPDGLAEVDGAPGNVWAVGNAAGHALVEHWDGTSWSRLSTPAPRHRFMTGIAYLARRNAWMVGTYRFGNREKTVIEHWDGASWTVRR
jgi:hypothetical protein